MGERRTREKWPNQKKGKYGTQVSLKKTGACLPSQRGKKERARKGGPGGAKNSKRNSREGCTASQGGGKIVTENSGGGFRNNLRINYWYKWQKPKYIPKVTLLLK